MTDPPPDGEPPRRPTTAPRGALSRLDPDRAVAARRRPPGAAAPGDGSPAATPGAATPGAAAPGDGSPAATPGAATPGAAAPGDGSPAAMPGAAAPRDGAAAATPPLAPAIDTRRYRWMIGGIGLTLVVVVSIIQFATHGIGTTGVPPGQRLRDFAAPLADTTLNGDPNLAPPCTLARHDPRALNICLISRREPLVLAFFVTASSSCERQVDALQTLSRRFPAAEVQFAAVAIDAGHAEIAHLARARHWTIPVAYDRDGSVGALYGVVVCPMVELARRGGIVDQRLIGGHWQTAAALAPRVQALLAAGPRHVGPA